METLYCGKGSVTDGIMPLGGQMTVGMQAMLCNDLVMSRPSSREMGGCVDGHG